MEKRKMAKYIFATIFCFIVLLILIMVIPLLNEVAFEGSNNTKAYTEEEMFNMGIDKGMWITKGENEAQEHNIVKSPSR